MSSSSLRGEAVRLASTGLSPIPIRCDGSKVAAVAWKEYQERIATPDELGVWFQKEWGLAIVTGEVSGHLEVIDFDDGSLFEPWLDLVKQHGGEELVNNLTLVLTPRGGYHIYYFCPDGIAPSQKLAQSRTSDADTRVLIETRGEGHMYSSPIHRRSAIR